MSTFVLGIAVGVAATVACVGAIRVTGETIGQVATVAQELWGDRHAQRQFTNPNYN